MLAPVFLEDNVMGAWLASTKTHYISSGRSHDGDSKGVSYERCTEKNLLVHLMGSEVDWHKIVGRAVMHCFARHLATTGAEWRRSMNVT